MVPIPWLDPKLDALDQKARQLIHTLFPNTTQCIVLVCTREELIEAVKKELRKCGMSEVIVKQQEPKLGFICGKLFREQKEVWVVEDEGENLDIIVHELLHNIQVCDVNREGITDFITYKLTKNPDWIDPYTLDNWLEIERQLGFKMIKRRFLTEGDCEDL